MDLSLAWFNKFNASFSSEGSQEDMLEFIVEESASDNFSGISITKFFMDVRTINFVI